MKNNKNNEEEIPQIMNRQYKYDDIIMFEIFKIT